jgi:hypothetical protein
MMTTPDTNSTKNFSAPEKVRLGSWLCTSWNRAAPAVMMAFDQVSMCFSARIDDNEDVKPALATAIFALSTKANATRCSLSMLPSRSWQILNGRHPNKVGVLPQVPIRNIAFEQSIARCVVVCPEMPIGLHRQTADSRPAGSLRVPGD